MPNIHERIAELTDLAKTYAEDGAFHTAANRLRQLADEIDAHISALTTPHLNPVGFEQRYGRAKRSTNPHDRYSKPDRAAIEQMAQAGTNPDVIKPAPGKVIEARGVFVPPSLDHLTEEQREAARRIDFIERAPKGSKRKP